MSRFDRVFTPCSLVGGSFRQDVFDVWNTNQLIPNEPRLSPWKRFASHHAVWPWSQRWVAVYMG
ncbi:MAG TPA: hypothetical protein VF783_18520 [Terriglobales bacterium]